MIVQEQRTRTIEDLARAAGDCFVGLTGDAKTSVSGLAYDSRALQPGDLFFCIPGLVHDGHEFAAAAASAGAAGLCVERATNAGVAEMLVSDARTAMARISAEWFGRPADDLLLIGVTGTNGKTTTAFLLEAILVAAGRRTGLIGTIETRIGDRRRAGVRTTPESLELHALFSEMRDAGVDAVAMEVTSHGLALRRVDGVRFDSAAFTNLSQDHLDFHSSMDDYFEAKRALFVPERARRGAVNIDDPYGRLLHDRSTIPTLTFGTSEDAQVRALDVSSDAHGSSFVLVTPTGETKIQTALVGTFNVSNCLAAAAAAVQAGLDLAAIETGIRALERVPGRLEKVDEGQPFAVVVDYAHTPDSLDNVLRTARTVASGHATARGRVICVFGCGGDRDRAKRPLMGSAAGRLADHVIVTSDNPRSEDPERIISEILEGVVAVRPEGANAVLVDRSEAIAAAITAARTGDVVVIAGKGHEMGQEFADHTIRFDDRDVARDALKEAGFGVSP